MRKTRNSSSQHNSVQLHRKHKQQLQKVVGYVSSESLFFAKVIHQM